jgi:hypothetical protein
MGWVRLSPAEKSEGLVGLNRDVVGSIPRFGGCL